MWRVAVIMALLALLTACTGLKCRCNRKYSIAHRQVSGGLENAVTDCDETNTCEVKKEACAGDRDCSAMLNFTREHSQQPAMRPACYYEVNGMQGCHWFSGAFAYACDRTRGIFRNSPHNYRCMGEDYCNDLTDAAVNDICEDFEYPQ